MRLALPAIGRTPLMKKTPVSLFVSRKLKS